MTRIHLSKNSGWCLLLALLLSNGWVIAQNSFGPGKRGFCGIAVSKSLLKTLEPQIAFLQLKEGDTLVDVGAGSGWFEGALACIVPVEKLHFVLVDIDSVCLNPTTVQKMKAYYEEVKGDSIGHGYDIVLNKPDTLKLSKMYRKFLLRNTLHEIENPQRLINTIGAHTQPGGELLVMELLGTSKRRLHGGCRKPLLSFVQLNALMEAAGFLLKERQEETLSKKNSFHLFRYRKV